MAAAAKTVVRNDFTRLWFVENRAGPNSSPRFVRAGKAGTLAWNQGNVTPIYEPSDSQPGVFNQINNQPGTPDSPQLPVTIREELEAQNLLLRLLNQGNCDHDWQVAIGACKNPQDFNRGWQKKKILEAARISNYGSSGDLGALQPGDRNLTEETATLNGASLYEVTQLTFAELLGSTVTRPMIDVVVADSVTCGGDCGVQSSGCDKVIFISSATTGSAGLPPVVIVSDDGGATGLSIAINSLGAGEDPDAGAWVGDNLVVVAADSESLHYASIDDLINNAAAPFTEVTTGFVATKGPQAIYSPGPNDVFIVGLGGYIYYTTDPTDGVTVASAGTVTTNNLTAVHGIDNNHVVAVGESNTIVVTHDGSTWATRTGPSAQAGVAARAVSMVTKDIYWVGYDNGKLYYTVDDGTNWTESGFPGSGAGGVKDIVFVTRTVGFLAHSTASPGGRIFRTTNGGGSWYLLPEATGASAIPANDHVYALAACDPNTVYGAGMADNASDGFAVKAS